MRNLAISVGLLSPLGIVVGVTLIGSPVGPALAFVGRVGIVLGLTELAVLLPAVILSGVLPTFTGPEEEEDGWDDRSLCPSSPGLGTPASRVSASAVERR